VSHVLAQVGATAVHGAHSARSPPLGAFVVCHGDFCGFWSLAIGPWYGAGKHEDFLSRRLGRASEIGRAVYDVGASQGSGAVPGACIRPNTSSNEELPQAYDCRTI
jgi:hypothetical protein